MGYTKQWISPAAPTRNDPVAWKTLAQDIHNNMIEAGFAWEHVVGELGNFDIYPPNNTDAGFRIYKVQDDLAQQGHNIFIKITFGVGNVGFYAGYDSSHSSNHPRFKVDIGTEIGGSGEIGALSKPVSYALPMTFSATNSASSIENSSPNKPCFMSVNHELGFFGFIHGIGASGINISRGFRSCNMFFLIQRDLDENMVPTNNGFTVLWPRSDSTGGTNNNLWPNNYTYGCYTGFVRYDGSVLFSDRAQYVPFSDRQDAAEDGSIQICPVYTMTPTRKQLPTINAYHSATIGEGTQYQVQVAPSKTMNFVALGSNHFCLPCTAYNSYTTIGAFGMLFE